MLIIVEPNALHNQLPHLSKKLIDGQRRSGSAGGATASVCGVGINAPTRMGPAFFPPGVQGPALAGRRWRRIQTKPNSFPLISHIGEAGKAAGRAGLPLITVALHRENPAEY